MATESSSLSRFTCITCRVAFKGAEIQRAHYKTDWHRYNLKRKVAELPPVSTESFQEKVLAQKEAASATKTGGQEVCEACKKHFTSQNSYQSHLRSRKHREVVAKQPERKDDTSLAKDQETADTPQSSEANEDEIDSESEPEPLDIKECLFCPQESSNMEQSLSHMTRTHGFFIPELEYLVNVEGLITYLCEKVGVGYMCLYCNDKGKSFHSVESVQQHMTDKGHCKLFFDDDAALEYTEYYDYSKSYPGSRRTGDTSKDTSQAVAIPDTTIEVNDDLELTLPSGTKIGHRAMKQYYKQHLPTQEQRKSAFVSRLLSQYRALGWKGYGGTVGGMLRQRDEAWGRKMQKAKEMKLGVKANKFQPHLRPQVVF